MNMKNLPLTSTALQHKNRRIVDQDPYYHTLAADVYTWLEPATAEVSKYLYLSNNTKTHRYISVWHESGDRLLYYHRESYSSKYCNGIIIFTGITGIWFPPSLPYPAYAKFRNKLNLQSQRIYITMKGTLQMCCWNKLHCLHLLDQMQMYLLVAHKRKSKTSSPKLKFDQIALSFK